MGNSVVKCCAAGEGTVRVMTPEGNVEEFEWPVSAADVMERHPGYFVIDTTLLRFKGNKHQVVPDKVRFMPSCMTLRPGKLYVLYIINNSTAEPGKSIPLTSVTEDSVCFPVSPENQIVVPSHPTLSKSYSYSAPHSKKVSLDNSRSFPSRVSTVQFEQFTPTFKRRRSSMVIASDILHSFQVKKEASVEVPVIPEPKEEKPRGHAWSPSLSSIPESTANSFRVMQASTTTKQFYKTAPRNSSDMDSLKEAILHKHPTSFWR